MPGRAAHQESTTWGAFSRECPWPWRATNGDEDRSRLAWGKVYLATGLSPPIRPSAKALQRCPMALRATNGDEDRSRLAWGKSMESRQRIAANMEALVTAG